MAYQNFFASRLYTDIGASDVTITLEQAPTALSGRMVLEARNPTQREIIEYTGVSGNQLTGVTRGVGGTSAKSHLKTALIEMNLTAEDIADLYAAFASFAASGDGWLSSVAVFTTASGYNKGNKEFDISTSIDLTSLLSVGNRLKFTRGTAPPTQCADLESSSSQYATRASGSVAGLLFTDDYTIEGWIKPESYPASRAGLFTRLGASGFITTIESTGKLVIQGIGAAGVPNESFTTDISVPIGEWTHFALTQDMSGGVGTAYFNGVAIPGTYTSPSPGNSFVQAGDLQIGAYTSGNFFDGKIADVRLWNTIRTATQIRDNMNQVVNPASAGLVGNWILNGNFNDSTANANHLTGVGGAVATDTDNPMKAIEYGIIHKITPTTITLFTGTDHNIPLGVALDSPQYSYQKAPRGFPVDKGKWRVQVLCLVNSVINTPAAGTWYNPAPLQIALPTGAWELGYFTTFQIDHSATGSASKVGMVSLSSSATSSLDVRFDTCVAVTSNYLRLPIKVTHPVSVTTPTTYYLLGKNVIGIGTAMYFLGAEGTTMITAESAYI